jgi:hypothetical protein
MAGNDWNFLVKLRLEWEILEAEQPLR